jgi:SAM-dependent methyltransferase
MNKVWNDRYNTEEYYYGTKPNDFLENNIGILKPNGSVLCLGEGEGRNSVFLAKKSFQVTAVDYSQVALDKLQKLANENGVQVTTICADLNTFEIKKEHWDGIISIWCHLPSSLRREIHKKVISGLKSNGVFLLEAYTPNQIPLGTGGPKDPDMMPTAEILKKELNPLQFDFLTEINREVHEGTGHNGMSSVVQAIAVKK